MAFAMLAIDPGPTESAWVGTEGGVVLFGKEPNEKILERIRAVHWNAVVVEMIASYGMAVGAEVFETCVWIGRFEQTCLARAPFHRMYRRDVKLHWCGTTKANDSNIRQAVIDHYGGKAAAIGTKKAPGPCYGITKDVWQALALGLAWQAKGGSNVEA